MPRLRHAIPLLILAAACGRDEVLGPDAPVVIDGPPAIDAPPLIDAMPRLCTAAMGTAAVTVNGTGPSVVERRLHAGALWLTGPVAGPAPMTMSLLFTNTSPFDANEFGCCEAADTTCCGTAGVMVETMAINAGTEVGDHPITATRTDDPTFMLDGTLTITDFVHPFLSTPGHIAGSVSASMGGDDVSGTFDNDFCTFLLNQTI